MRESVVRKDHVKKRPCDGPPLSRRASAALRRGRTSSRWGRVCACAGRCVPYTDTCAVGRATCSHTHMHTCATLHRQALDLEEAAARDILASAHVGPCLLAICRALVHTREMSNACLLAMCHALVHTREMSNACLLAMCHALVPSLVQWCSGSGRAAMTPRSVRGHPIHSGRSGDVHRLRRGAHAGAAGCFVASEGC